MKKSLYKPAHHLFVIVLLIIACDDDVSSDTMVNEDDELITVLCTPRVTQINENSFDTGVDFPDWTNSLYNLPYAVGSSYLVGQGNNTQGSHQGIWRSSYDFEMPIGTEILAVRGGKVVDAFEASRNGDANSGNFVMVQHQDGTVAFYLHLSRDGVLIEIGETVTRGQLIAISGNSGNTGGIPHLHFGVHQCQGIPPGPWNTSSEGLCATIPISFKNTEENPNGLGEGFCYEALGN